MLGSSPLFDGDTPSLTAYWERRSKNIEWDGSVACVVSLITFKTALFQFQLFHIQIMKGGDLSYKISCLQLASWGRSFNRSDAFRKEDCRPKRRPPPPKKKKKTMTRPCCTLALYKIQLKYHFARTIHLSIRTWMSMSRVQRARYALKNLIGLFILKGIASLNVYSVCIQIQGGVWVA